MRETSRIGGYVEPGYFVAQCFRGTGKTALEVLSLIEPGDCGLLVLDCKYLLHNFEDENSGAELTTWFKTLVEHQKRLNCAMVVVDHSKKNAKTNAADDIDFAHGSGASARIVDGVITLRHHRFKGRYYMGAVVRSGKSPEPTTIVCGDDGVWRAVLDLPGELPGKNGQEDLTASEPDIAAFPGSTEPPPSAYVEPDLRAWRALREVDKPLTKSEAIAKLCDTIRDKPVNGKLIGDKRAGKLFDAAKVNGLLVELPRQEGDRTNKFKAVDGVEYAGRWVPVFVADALAAIDATREGGWPS
jgi:hypothetical protein